MIKYAPNTLNLFKEMELPEQLKAMKKCGFEMVEILFPYMAPVKTVKELLNANSMQVSIIDVLPGDIMKMDISAAIDPKRVDEFRENAQLALQYAIELDVPFVNCISGCVGAVENSSREKMLDIYKENIVFTCDLFKGTDKKILIEPVSEFMFPGYLTGDLHEAAGLIDELNINNLALQFDFFHIQLLHGNLAGNIKKYFNRIGYYQIANPPGRHQPGYGEINFPYLIDVLRQLGYDGVIGLEYDPEGSSAESFGWLDQVR